MKATRPRLFTWTLSGVPLACAAAVVAVGIWGSPAAFANDRYFQATGKDCSSCHVNVSYNYRQLTRYGHAFWNNNCPGVRGGCRR
jgi:hypothetical protein